MASSRKRPNGKDIAVARSGGIDSVSLLHFLKNNSCDEIQGFHSGKPEAAEEFRKLLEKRPSESRR